MAFNDAFRQGQQQGNGVFSGWFCRTRRGVGGEYAVGCQGWHIQRVEACTVSCHQFQWWTSNLDELCAYIATANKCHLCARKSIEFAIENQVSDAIQACSSFWMEVGF